MLAGGGQRADVIRWEINQSGKCCNFGVRVKWSSLLLSEGLSPLPLGALQGHEVTVVNMQKLQQFIEQQKTAHSMK